MLACRKPSAGLVLRIASVAQASALVCAQCHCELGLQVEMQDYMTGDVSNLLLPTSCLELTPANTKIVASGGAGRVSMSRLRHDIVVAGGSLARKGTAVVTARAAF